MKRKNLKVIIPLVLGLLLLLSVAFVPFIRSIVVMKAFSIYEKQDSLFQDKNIDVSIPGGLSTSRKDWYPFVITYNADRGFSGFIGEDVRLTILYNFGHFSLFEGQSSFYDTDSPYYSSFYGGYGVQRESKEPFGFSQGKPVLDQLMQVMEFDLTKLVLRDLGKVDPVFEYKLDKMEETTLFDEENWWKVEGKIITNGVYHGYNQKRRNYLQYGKPPGNKSDIEDFSMITLNGTMYVKYLKTQNLTVAFYVLSPDIQVIESWDEEILRETEFTISE